MKVHQLCARLEFGDAVSNHVLEIDRALAGWGFETAVYANTRDEWGCGLARPDSEYDGSAGPGDDLLIFHYSVYCPNYSRYLESGHRKILVYHNITPPEFFEPYDKGVAEFCRLGRRLLGELKDCELALGDSEFNRLELVRAGFDEGRTGVLPIFMDNEGLLAEERNPRLLEACRESYNVLFVGRAVPNKRLEDVIRAFFYYNRCVNAGSHLFLIGAAWVGRYGAQLRWLTDSMALWDNVHFAGRVSRSELATYYDSADLFLSMSEHEGFGVPLVESMAFEVPVLAFDSTAVPYTLGGTGVLFNEKDFGRVGELMEILRSRGARQAVLSGQRKRLADFSPEAVRGILRESIGRVTGEAP